VLETDGIGTFHVFNTHFPYRVVEQQARINTARLIAARLARISPSVPVVVTADFNAPSDGEVYGLLAADLRDAWCDAAPRTGLHGTLNGFGRHTFDRRIDWILHRGPWRVRDAETVITQRDGRYPSDHFPVVATLEV
jgi:endonuclease/exonuclease/phosphatase family metal-dependent hydrolase